MSGAIETSSTGSGFVNAGSLLASLSGVSKQHAQDVLDTCLLAQLASDKVANRFTDIPAWFRNYISVLGDVGWNTQDVGFGPVRLKGTHVSLQSIILESLHGHAGQASIAVVAQSINALEDLPSGDAPVRIFDQQARTQSKAPERQNQSVIGNFQIATCFEQQGSVCMVLGAYRFTSGDCCRRILSCMYPCTGTEIWQSIQSAVLDESIYGPMRAKVQKKLAGLTSEYIKTLSL